MVDQPVMRAGLRDVINGEPDMAVCGEAENAREAMAAAQKLSPELALVDITMPGKSGLDMDLIQLTHEQDDPAL